MYRIKWLQRGKRENDTGKNITKIFAVTNARTGRLNNEIINNNTM